jgi:hypothetical protein
VVINGLNALILPSNDADGVPTLTSTLNVRISSYVRVSPYARDDDHAIGDIGYVVAIDAVITGIGDLRRSYGTLRGEVNKRN